MRKLASAVLLLSLLTILLPGCAATIVATAEPLCKEIKELKILKADVLTKPTARAILANNEARREICKG